MKALNCTPKACYSADYCILELQTQKIPIYNVLNFNDGIITGSAFISECDGGNFLGYLILKYLAPSNFNLNILTSENSIFTFLKQGVINDVFL